VRKIYAKDVFIRCSPGVDLVQLFGINVPPLFCKLHLFIAIQQLLLMFIKWSSLQKERVNLSQNSFMTTNPGVNLIKLFGHNFTHTFCKLNHCTNVTIIFLCCEKI